MKMNRRLALITLGLLLPLVFTTGCAVAQNQKPAEQTLRVMTYNIHHGEGLDGKVDLERIATLIKEQRADIVGLQEVDKGVERTAKRDLPAELAKLTGMTCIFSNNYHHQGGEYGNAVLTRFPVKSWTNRHYKMLRPGEQRGILQLILDVHGRELVFMNTHIDYRPDDSERLSNVEEIRELLKTYAGKPVVLTGDFNDTPESRTCTRLAEMFTDSWAAAGQGDGFTIPVKQPRKRIDYIWLSKGAPLEAKSISVLQSEASDHLPVIAELRFY